MSRAELRHGEAVRGNTPFRILFRPQSGGTRYVERDIETARERWSGRAWNNGWLPRDRRAGQDPRARSGCGRPSRCRGTHQGSREQAQTVLAKWAANAPLAFVDQYVLELKRYRAIAIDVGDQDGLRVDAGKLYDVLDQYGIANAFEVYPGTHTSDVAVRFQEHVMPFFSKNLAFAGVRK